MTPAPSAETQALLQVLRGALLRYAPAAEGFLLAVSGGLDSMALLHLTAESGLGSEGRLVVAHLNHGLRGEESRRDAELVRVAAERLGLPVVVEVLAESELQQRPGETLEEAARKVRYRFLQRVAEEQLRLIRRPRLAFPPQLLGLHRMKLCHPPSLPTPVPGTCRALTGTDWHVPGTSQCPSFAAKTALVSAQD